jgi:hypothetical protein
MINFDEPNHRYYLEDGRIVPSVTQILSMMGKSSAFYKDNGAKERGTLIHKITQLFESGDGFNIFDVEDYSLLPYLEHYQAIKDILNPTYTGIEQLVFNDKLFYAGTLDRKGTIDGIPFIADIKTGSTIPSFSNLQTAAYAMAEFPDNYKQVQRYVFHIHPNRKKPNIKPYTNETDFLEWEVLCNRFHKQEEEVLV